MIFVLCLSFSLDGFAQTEKEKPEKRFIGRVIKLDDQLDDLLDSKAQAEVLAGGFDWVEGPAWDKKNGYLLFSNIPKNRIHKWHPKEGVSIFLEPSGYDGADRVTGREPGSNGLMFDAKGRLVVCDHGNRRVYRYEDGKKKTLADRFDGKRFNSPNDLVIHSSGDIYFTDPPYGLAKKTEREIDWNGVYVLRSKTGKVELLTKEFTRPNGIALSPDEKKLYVAQSDRAKMIYKSFDVKKDGTINSGQLFFDATKWVANDPGSADGMAVDAKGNIWATAPGGVLILSPEGNPLGRIMTGRPTANCAFGEDGKTLFLTANKLLCRIQTKVKGLGF